MKNKVFNVFQLNVENQNRIFGLDLLRAIAILLVVFSHGCLFILNKHFPDFPNFPYLDGVDLFFVLSGYLVGGIFIKDYNFHTNYSIKNLYDFWKRRWIRTLPLYFLILLLVLVLAYLRSGFIINQGVLPYFIFMQNFNWSCGWFFPESWSLAIEEWFYLIFPFSVYLLSSVFTTAKFKGFNIFIVVISIIVFSTFLRGYYYNMHMELSEYDYFRKAVVLRLDSIMFGVIGAIAHRNFKQIWNRLTLQIPLLTVGLIILIWGPFLRQDYQYFGFIFFPTIESIGVLFLLPILSNFRKMDGVIGALITRISLVSYSMYMLNWTIIVNNLNRILPEYSDNQSVVVFVFYFIIVYLASVLMYKYFELPILMLRDRKNLYFSLRSIFRIRPFYFLLKKTVFRK